MSTEQDQFPVPSFVGAMVRAVAQKGLTAAATALLANGVIQPSQQAQVESVGLSMVLWAVSFAWTWVHEQANNRTIKAALNAEPVKPPVSVLP